MATMKELSYGKPYGKISRNKELKKATEAKGHWECKQHGTQCKHIITTLIDELNAKGITPSTLANKDKEIVNKALKWVEE